MPSIFVIIPVSMVILIAAISWVWDRRWRPLQTKRGIPCPSFSKNMSLIFQSIIKDSGDKSKKGVSGLDWRIVHVVLIAISALAVYLWATARVDASWKVMVPVIVIPLLISMGRISSVKKQTMKQISDVFSVANPKLFYLRADRTANLHPWDFINVTKLTDGGQVESVSLLLPATFSVSSVEARATFEREFSALMSASTESDWVFDWKPEKRQLVARRVPPLPKSVDYPGSKDKPWNEIPIGVSNKGQECWNLADTPQGIILGMTGSGKSVTQRSILYHAFQHPDEIRMFGIDLKRVELTMWENYPGMIEVAVDAESALEVISNAREVMMERFSKMKEARVNHIDKLPGKKEPAIIVMFDESAEALMLGAGKSPEAKEENAMKAEIGDHVKSIARLGRAAKVHLVLCTQRAQVDAIGGGDAKNNFGFRIMLGHGDKNASMMALDTMTGTETEPNMKGRGVISRSGAEVKFQSYWTPEDWPEKNGIYPIGFEPKSESSAIIDDVDDADYENEENRIAEDMSSKEDAPSLYSGIIEDTDDGTIEIIHEGEDESVPDDEYGFVPIQFDDDVVPVRTSQHEPDEEVAHESTFLAGVSEDDYEDAGESASESASEGEFGEDIPLDVLGIDDDDDDDDDDDPEDALGLALKDSDLNFR